MATRRKTAGVEVEPNASAALADLMRETVDAQGRPTDPVGRARWLAKEFARIADVADEDDRIARKVDDVFRLYTESGWAMRRQPGAAEREARVVVLFKLWVMTQSTLDGTPRTAPDDDGPSARAVRALLDTKPGAKRVGARSKYAVLRTWLQRELASRGRPVSKLTDAQVKHDVAALWRSLGREPQPARVNPKRTT